MKHWNDKLITLLNREHLPTWLNQNSPGGKMAEVGTYYGVFAEQIVRTWNGTLFCIDPWIDQPDSDYRDGCANGGVAGGRNPMKPIYENAITVLRQFGDRVKIVKGFSMDAVSTFERESLDCVYIDANHSFKTAKEDLTLWFERVRRGGLLGIHDCYIRKDAVQNCGVWDAVWNMAHWIDQQPFLTNCGSAWWIRNE